ncbi:hypothetical protein Leryth_026437 [Lithospermum erythrorhizon]|nr:hypothetical protein Leryth_026437 [Lithospermum erythrorhizon]
MISTTKLLKNKKTKLLVSELLMNGLDLGSLSSMVSVVYKIDTWTQIIVNLSILLVLKLGTDYWSRKLSETDDHLVACLVSSSLMKLKML